MFQGHSICNLDAKSRLILPSRLRQDIKSDEDKKLIMTRGLDEHSLYLYIKSDWIKQVEIVTEKINQFVDIERKFYEAFMMYANDCEIDNQNRILIPSQLVEYAKLKKEVILIGLNDKIGIWDPKIREEVKSSEAQSELMKLINQIPKLLN